MKDLCKEIKYAIMAANDQGRLQRVQELKAKKLLIKQKIQECKSAAYKLKTQQNSPISPNE